MAESVADVLRKIGLSNLISHFLEESINLDTVSKLTDENLNDLGINKLGDRIRFKDECQKLSQEGNSRRQEWGNNSITATGGGGITTVTSVTPTHSSSAASNISAERSLLFRPYNNPSSSNDNSNFHIYSREFILVYNIREQCISYI